LLEGGCVKRLGAADDIIEEYINSNLSLTCDLADRPRTGNGRAKFIELQMFNGRGQATQSHISGDDLIVRMAISSQETMGNVAAAIVLQNIHGVRLITSWTGESGFPVHLKKGLQTIECRFRNVRLRPGHQFTISLWMAAQEVLDSVQEVQVVPVLASERDQEFSTSLDQGIVLCDYTWSMVQQ
jgi:hypothetical protein